MALRACFQVIREKCRPFPVCWKVAKRYGLQTSQNFLNIVTGVRVPKRSTSSLCSTGSQNIQHATVWQEVPAQEVLQSCPLLKLKLGPKRLLLHKCCVTEAMCEGEVPAPLCKECRRCLVKNPPEMPVRALANGMWIGRHPELMRC